MQQQSHSMLKSKHLEHSTEEKEIELFSYIDLLNYMLKYKIPQIVTLIRNFSNRQKIQNLVYPSGIYFDKENDDYRTENENEVFKIFRRFTASCEGGKEKATTDFARLSPSVGMRRLERPTPTSRT